MYADVAESCSAAAAVAAPAILKESWHIAVGCSQILQLSAHFFLCSSCLLGGAEPLWAVVQQLSLMTRRLQQSLIMLSELRDVVRTCAQ